MPRKKQTSNNKISNPKFPENPNKVRFTIRLAKFWADRVQKEVLDTDRFPNFNRFAEYCIIQYLDHQENFAPSVNLEPFITEQKAFFTEFRQILDNAAAQPKPVNFAEKVKKIKYLTKTPKNFTDLASLSEISDAELLIVLGDLLNKNEIAYNANWEYYNVKSQEDPE